jgi:hypothetical protein
MSLLHLPMPDPGSPDLRSSLRLLAWLGRSQRKGQLLSVLWGTLLMGSQAATPFLVGIGIQAAIDHHARQLWLAGAGALTLGVLQCAGSVLLHRQAVWNWVTAASQVRQLVARQASTLGAGLSRRIATGEIVAVSSGDVEKIGWFVEVSSRCGAALVVWLGVSGANRSSAWPCCSGSRSWPSRSGRCCARSRPASPVSVNSAERPPNWRPTP